MGLFVMTTLYCSIRAADAEFKSVLWIAAAIVACALGMGTKEVTFAAPILVSEGSQARKRIEAGFEEFRQLFPAALCYTKIVPVDEVVTLTLYYREDDHLMRLMLSDSEQKQLDKLWDELHYISQDALTLVDALEQLIQYATQDADPKVFEPLRKPFAERGAAYRQRLVDTEPRHLESLLAFAGQAYRRPMSEAESKELSNLYARLRQQEIPHEDALRLTLAPLPDRLVDIGREVAVALQAVLIVEHARVGRTALPARDRRIFRVQPVEVVHRQRFGGLQQVRLKSAQRILGLELEHIVGELVGRIEFGARDRVKRCELLLGRGFLALKMRVAVTSANGVPAAFVIARPIAPVAKLLSHG